MGVTKIDAGIWRWWIYLDNDATKWVASSDNCASKVAMAAVASGQIACAVIAMCSAITGQMLNAANRGNGVIIKVPYPFFPSQAVVVPQ